MKNNDDPPDPAEDESNYLPDDRIAAQEHERLLEHRRAAQAKKKALFGSGFTMEHIQIPIGFFQADLSPTQAAVLAIVVYSFNKDWGHSKIKTVTIARILKMSQSRVSEVLKKLQPKYLEISEMKEAAWKAMKTLNYWKGKNTGKKADFRTRTRKKLVPTDLTWELCIDYQEKLINRTWILKILDRSEKRDFGKPKFL